jgi:DNA topoisomerase I
VCRKCYVHPAVIQSYTDGTLLRALRRRLKKEINDSHDLGPEEAAVLRLLKAGITSATKAAPKARENGAKA